MAQNKNALLRYRTIDRCLRNTGRKWTLNDLVEACSDALYEFEGKQDPISLRTIQLDIQMMRSERLGYEAPIEVYERKYYRYSDPDYSINNRPLTEHDCEVLNRTIDLLRQYDEFDRYHDMAEVVNRLQDKVASTKRKPIVEFERNPNLKGIGHLNGLYDLIASRKTINVCYQSFNSRKPKNYVLFPHLLKEYRNRWFLFGTRAEDSKLFNLALDRIISFMPEEGIPYRDNPEFMEDFFSDVIGVTKHSKLNKAKIRIKAFGTQADYIVTKPLHSSQRLVTSDRNADYKTFEIEVVINNELIAQLMSFGAGIKVISPESLVNDLREIYKNGLSLYDDVTLHN